MTSRNGILLLGQYILLSLLFRDQQCMGHRIQSIIADSPIRNSNNNNKNKSDRILTSYVDSSKSDLLNNNFFRRHGHQKQEHHSKEKEHELMSATTAIANVLADLCPHGMLPIGTFAA
jgi:hypothetical protein